MMEGSDPVITFVYQPLYGPVPGYQDGAKLGMEVLLKLKKEGGERGEWRVCQATF